MDAQNAVTQAKSKFSQAIEHFRDELKKVRTGRAHASMLDGVVVEAYGTPMPLNQVATVSAPESQQLQVTPFDPSNLQAIANAIRNNPSLGMNPSDDGRVVRVPVPALNEELRREYVKVVGGKVEDCMIALRNIRHDAMDAVDKSKKAKEIGEDDATRLQKQVDEAMNQAKAEAESAAKVKEQEILTV
jgi:ribosome recycling factor